MEDTNYIVVESWMINRLKLRANNLLTFAFIHGFSWDKSSKFIGSLKYMEDAIGASRPTVLKSLNFLVDKGLITKHEKIRNNIKLASYSTNFVRDDFIGSKDPLRGVKDLYGGSKGSLPNTTNITTTSDSNKNSKIKPNQFSKFWELYPRKVDKGKALSKWDQICSRKSNVPAWKEIEKAIHAQKETPRWQQKEYIPHPTTWLNNNRWLDDPEEMITHNYKDSQNEDKIDFSNIPTHRYDFKKKKKKARKQNQT